MRRAVRSVDCWVGFGLVLMGVVYVQQSQQINASMMMSDMLGPRAFPNALGAALVLVGIAVALRALMTAAPATDAGSTSMLATLAGASIVYLLAFNVLGYIISTATFLAFLAYCLGERRHRLTASLSIGVALVLYVGFGQFLNVALPKGLLGF